MDDRISSLPDEVLCYILSFLPTKLSVSTCVLSKRWKPLCGSVPALDFEYPYHQRWNQPESPSAFVLSLCSFILSRTLEQPIRRFRLRISSSVVYEIHTFVRAVVSRFRVQHLHLDFSYLIDMSSVLPSCHTLTVLKLRNVKFETLPSLDLSLLKVLHLYTVHTLDANPLQQILSACRNLEDLEVKNVCIACHDYESKGKFKPLSNLVRAVIDIGAVPLKVLYNVQFLHMKILYMDQHGMISDPIPVFHNLTFLKLSNEYYCDLNPSIYWHYVFQVFKHCPKLQNLSIDKARFDSLSSMDGSPFPQCVPRCISFNLRTCLLNHFSGSYLEFEFAKYIMENAKFLRDMIICSDTRQDVDESETLKALSFCSRSSTCNLSFRKF